MEKTRYRRYKKARSSINPCSARVFRLNRCNTPVTRFFTADDKGKSYAELLAKEVEGKVYLLNPITAGALEKDA